MCFEPFVHKTRDPYLNRIGILTVNTRVCPNVSGLTYKSRAKWKILRGIYSAIYGEVNVPVCVEIKGDYIKIAKLFYLCHL